MWYIFCVTISVKSSRFVPTAFIATSVVPNFTVSRSSGPPDAVLAEVVVAAVLMLLLLLVVELLEGRIGEELAECEGVL